jgi:hypothetical protein
MAYGQLNISSINGSGLENNLLINPEFTVNQRGSATPTTTSNAYNYDRWYYDGTYLYQGIEGNNLRATTYTLSWTGAMTASYSLNTGAASSQSGQSWTSVANGTNITIASVGSNNLWIRFSAQPTQPKLELGTSQTTFVPRLYGQELALCQRYYWKVSGSNASQYIFSGYWGNSSTGVIVAKTAVTMRTAPTVSASNVIAVNTVGADGLYSSIASQQATIEGSRLALTVTGTSGVINGYPSALGFSTTSPSYMDFSAEL